MSTSRSPVDRDPETQTRTGKRKRRPANSNLGSRTTLEYGLMRDTGEHDVARFIGSGSGIHFIRTVYLRLGRRSALRPSQVPGAENLVPGEDDQLQQQQGAGSRERPRNLLWSPQEAIADDEVNHPSFEQLVEWSKGYFEAWHPALPFLDGEDVLQIFEKVSQGQVLSLGHLDLVILKSVLSISLADSRQRCALQQGIPRSLLFSSIEDAVSSSSFALCQPASLRATQAALAVQTFLISMLYLNAASRLGGLIVRMAFHLGLHRCPARFPFFTPKEAAIRRRVFWCLYCSERLLCQSLGLPLDIQDSDVDVCYPGEEEHSATVSEGDARKLQLFTYIAKHARIRGLILELRNKSIASRQDTADRVSFVQTELAKWSNEIQDAVEMDSVDLNVNSGVSISASHQLLLLLLKHESMIALNRPVMTSDHMNASQSAALHACISAARSICIGLHKHVMRYRDTGDETRDKLSEPLTWPSFTWIIWVSAFVLLHAASEKQIPLSSALRHVRSGQEVLRHISARNTSWPEYCLGAIDELALAVQEILDNEHQETPDTDTMLQAHISNTEEMEPNSTPIATRRKVGGISSQGPLAQHITTSPGLPFESPSLGLEKDSLRGGAHDRQRQGLSRLTREPQYHQAYTSGNQPAISHANAQQRFLPDVYETQESTVHVLPAEGQESIVWYDQLFTNTFNAIDNPFLATAQSDPEIDTTWSYLRDGGGI